MSEISEFIRKSFKEGDDKRDAGLTTPEDIIRYDNLLYGEDPKRRSEFYLSPGARISVSGAFGRHQFRLCLGTGP